MADRIWRLREAAPTVLTREAIAAGIPALVTQVLFARGLTDLQAMSAFLDGQFDAVATDPYQMRDMDRAVARLRQAIRDGEKIAVYGDYDADGVTATALLLGVLTKLGGKVEPYIPHRAGEGYGLHTRALPGLKERGVGVVLTVDCGISGFAEVEAGSKLGLEFIITDHHNPHPPLPPAVAILNPKREDGGYPFRELAGVGVAFKLAQALAAEIRPDLAAEIEDECLDLVALGTVADVVPLLDENRSLVKRGLRALNDHARPLRPGLIELLAVAGLSRGTIGEWHIGFVLAPRLNAAGRMADAHTALTLLTTDSVEIARDAARRLDEHNRERQRLTEEGAEKGRGLALARLDEGPVLVVGDESLAIGVVGLIAAKLSEEFGRPAIVLARDGERWRGSARSIPGFDVGAALAECAGLLVKHGGHPMAAGLTVVPEMLPALRARLNEIGRRCLDGMDIRATVWLDAELPLPEARSRAFPAFRLLPPYGLGNPEPVFLARGVEVTERRTVGVNGAHLKLELAHGGSLFNRTIGFGLGSMAGELPRFVDLAYSVAEAEWNGRTYFELRLKDVRPAGTWNL